MGNDVAVPPLFRILRRASPTGCSSVMDEHRDFTDIEQTSRVSQSRAVVARTRHLFFLLPTIPRRVYRF